MPNANAGIAALIIKRFLDIRHAGRQLLSVFDVGSNNLNYALCEVANPVPIHTAQVRTGLGKEFRELSSGRIAVPAKQVAAFKRAVKPILQIDQAIDSQKQAIATGISRRSDVSDILAEWFQSKWNTDFKVLSEEEETELAALAAQELIPAGARAAIVDIGGFSTELVLPGSKHKAVRISLPLGLLTLRKAESEGIAADTVIRQELVRVPYFKPELLICVGLSAVFLAKIIKRIDKYQADLIHGAKISRQELEDTRIELESGDASELMRFAMERQSPSFINLSTMFYTLLLDKFGASEFVVCQYGISTGYNLWKKRGRNRLR